MQFDLLTVYKTCINQHCFQGERGTLTSQIKKYSKCSKTFGIDCSLSAEGFKMPLNDKYIEECYLIFPSRSFCSV